MQRVVSDVINQVVCHLLLQREQKQLAERRAAKAEQRTKFLKELETNGPEAASALAALFRAAALKYVFLMF
jgi:hypothetical protein